MQNVLSASVRRRLQFSRLLPLAIAALTTATCTPTSPDDFYDVLSPIWIQARWAGGAAGPPSNSSSDVPAKTISGQRYCNPSSLIMENHGSRFVSLLGNVARNELVIYNNCTIPIDIAICVTSGSGGGGSFIPVCSQAPLLTPLSNLNFYSMSASGDGIRSAMEESTPANIDINVFYCPEGMDFAAGVIPGANASACVNYK